MAVGNLFQDLRTEPFTKLDHPFLMAGGAEVAALAGKCQQIFMPTVRTFN